MTTRRDFLRNSAFTLSSLLAPWPFTQALAATVSSPKLTKFVDPLPIPRIMNQTVPNYYEISMGTVTHQFHRDLLPTTVWGYANSYPGPTIEAQKRTGITVKWLNNLPDNHFLPIDYTLDWANPNAISMNAPPGTPSGPIPVTPHLHGGFTLPQYDGHPMAWFTPGMMRTGEHFITDSYYYGNEQRASTLWYHDHAVGITRLNVYAGLAGFYLLRDAEEAALNLPGGPFEIPIVLQDRLLNPNGSLNYPNTGVTAMHPVWIPEFFGDTPVINGKAYPYLEVEPRRYRFRVLNGSNARFYNFWLDDGKRRVPFHQIGTDGGIGFVGSKNAVPLTSMLLAPGERADIIVDFSGMKSGTLLTAKNNASIPFPNGTSGTLPVLMQIRVNKPLSSPDTTPPAAQLALPGIVPLPTDTTTPRRQVVLKENMDMAAGAPLNALINGKHFMEPVDDMPKVGSTEIWEFVNLTGDAHPMHLHLVQFQILNRQPIDAAGFTAAWLAGSNPNVNQFLASAAKLPAANENGWKDTAQSYPGEVLRIAVKFDLPSGPLQLPKGMTNPQYVYHCHILEHEDNDMMRPFEIQP